MAIVCTIDISLLKFCIEIIGGQNNISHLRNIHQLRHKSIAPEELMVIDLQSCPEEDIPVIKCAAVALTVIPSYSQAMKLLKLGIRGYGNRHMHRDNLIQAFTAVRAGQVWLPPEIINQMITSFPNPGPLKEERGLIDPLSKREEEVVQWVAKGLSNREMAEQMNITVRTVKAHLTSIFSKTGFRDRLELAIKMKSRL